MLAFQRRGGLLPLARRRIGHLQRDDADGAVPRSYVDLPEYPPWVGSAEQCPRAANKCRGEHADASIGPRACKYAFLKSF